MLKKTGVSRIFSLQRSFPSFSYPLASLIPFFLLFTQQRFQRAGQLPHVQATPGSQPEFSPALIKFRTQTEAAQGPGRALRTTATSPHRPTWETRCSGPRGSDRTSGTKAAAGPGVVATRRSRPPGRSEQRRSPRKLSLFGCTSGRGSPGSHRRAIYLPDPVYPDAPGPPIWTSLSSPSRLREIGPVPGSRREARGGAGPGTLS